MGNLRVVKDHDDDPDDERCTCGHGRRMHEQTATSSRCLQDDRGSWCGCLKFRPRGVQDHEDLAGRCTCGHAQRMHEGRLDHPPSAAELAETATSSQCLYDDDSGDWCGCMRFRPAPASMGREGFEVHQACGTAHRLNDDCYVPPDSPRGMLGRAMHSTMTDHDRALDRIRAINELRQLLDNEEKMAVIGARQARCTWNELGEAIGTSRQGAFNRWGEMVQRFEKVGFLDDVEEGLDVEEPD